MRFHNYLVDFSSTDLERAGYSKKAHDARLIAGVYCPNSTFAKRYQSLGYQFMTLSNDKAMIREAARTILGQMA